MKGLKTGRRAVELTFIVITVVMALMLVAAAWGGLVPPASSRMMPLLTLAMPIVLAFNVLIAVVWLLMLQWKQALLPVVAIAISWSPVTTVCPVNLSSQNFDGKHVFKVMTFNVANFGPYDPSNHNPSPSMRYILDQNADFVLLQEGSQERDYLRLSNVEMMRQELESKYPYHSNGNRDLMILSKFPYTVVPDSAFDKNAATREVSAFVKAFDIILPGDKQLRIVSMHLRSIGMGESDKDLYDSITRHGVDVNKRSELSRIKHSLLAKLTRAFEHHAQESSVVRALIDKSPGNVIVCGDFNEAPSSYCYRTIAGDDLHDTFQECGAGYTYTFHDRRLLFKIDHILYRGDLQAVAWKRDKAGDSDHYPQVATFVWKK